MREGRTTRGALDDLTQAVWLRPEYADNLGVLFLRNGRLDLERREWETAVGLGPGKAGSARNLRRLEGG